MDFTKWHNKYCIDSRLHYPSIRTQENYQCSVGTFLKYFSIEIDPQHISTDKIKEWLLTFETINTRNHKLCAIIAGVATFLIWCPASIVYWVVTGHCSPLALIDEFIKWMEA